MNRRTLLATPLLLPSVVHAQTWPSRPVRIVVGFLPGGSNDILARLLSAHLPEHFPGGSFVVENRPGAGTLIAAEHVARAPADGHTLLYTSTSTVIASLVNPNARIDALEQFSPVAVATSLAMLLTTRTASPLRTMSDVIEAAKRTNGRLTVSHPGAGAINHLSLVLLMRQAGIELTLVPFVGNQPSLNACLRGDVDLASDSLFGARSLLEAGQLRPIALSSAYRLATHPDIPTFAETIPGYEVTTWNGLLAPRGTPEPIMDALNHAVDSILRRPDVRERIRGFGSEGVGGTRAAFGQTIAAEARRWAEVVREYNITAG